jgi:hypothetical protein
MPKADKCSEQLTCAGQRRYRGSVPQICFGAQAAKATHMTTKYKLMKSLVFSTSSRRFAAMPTARAEMNTSGADIITNGPQTNSGDRSGSWSAQQNVRDSERYEAVVRSNNSFRANRVQEECGPINDPQLHADCA